MISTGISHRTVGPIILPERNAPRGRILMPMRRSEWQLPSEKVGLHTIRDTRFWRLTARADDGAVVWRGRFYDREDADTFLFAMASGSLSYERELWKLPTPVWPDLPEGLVYEFTTYDVLSNTAVFTYNVPAEYNSSSSVTHCIGGGGSGGVSQGGSGNDRLATGGGGGAYSFRSNISLTPGGTCPIYIGPGGSAVSRSTGSGATNGNPGTDTTFNTTSVIADAGAAGPATSAGGGTLGGGAGGSASTGEGFTNGGAGGDCTDAGNGYYGSGGGGAGGPNNNGVAGTNNSTPNTSTAGGAGGGGTGGGGTAGSSGGGTGGNGTDITGSGVGSGGGGGGHQNSGGSATAGTGGNYGGGGGGCATGSGTATSGAGMQGVIVVEFNPVVPIPTRMPHYRKRLVIPVGY